MVLHCIWFYVVRDMGVDLLGSALAGFHEASCGIGMASVARAAFSVAPGIAQPGFGKA